MSTGLRIILLKRRDISLAPKNDGRAMKKRPKNLPKELRKKMLTRKGGRTIPRENGFLLVFIRGDGKGRRYKAIAWEYLSESNWCDTKKLAVDQVGLNPRSLPG